MRRPLSGRPLVAMLALAAPLMLSSSRAGSDPASPVGAEEAPVCQVPPAAPDWSVEEELARRAAKGELRGAPDVVMLNGRGYNYGPPPDRQLDLIRLEALEAEAEFRGR